MTRRAGRHCPKFVSDLFETIGPDLHLVHIVEPKQNYTIVSLRSFDDDRVIVRCSYPLPTFCRIQLVTS